MENILEVKGLRKEFDGFTLKDISFELPYGYIMGVIGPNGSGKTTTIKLIMNLLRRTQGEIRIFGMDNIRHEVEIKSRIGFVYDIPLFYDYMTLKQMKAVVAPFYKNWDEAVFMRYMDMFELPLKKKIKALSRGMVMKFALALALSHHAELIVLDEPTSGLDPVFRRELLNILSGVIQDERKSILFSTHVTSDLERVADYITFIHKGELVFSRVKDDIFANYGVVKGDKKLLSRVNPAMVKGYTEGQFGLEALTDNMEEMRQQLRAEEGVFVEKASLEDIMFYTGRQGGQHV